MQGVVLILGPERFLAREALARVLRRHPEQEVIRHDGATAAPGEVLDDVRTPSLLGEPRAVVVENAADLLRGALQAFAAYAERPARGALLVLLASGVDGRLKGAKELKAAAEVIECEPPKEWQVSDWISARARDPHGLQPEAGAAEALRARVGEDLGLLDAALVRLREQIAPRTFLRREDVEGSTEAHRSAVLFEPGNALEAADLAAALRAVGAAFDEGLRISQGVVTDEDAVAAILLDNLHRAYAKLVRFHMHRRGGTSDEEAARRAGCTPKQVNFFVQRARRHRLDALLARHRHFLEADLALKGSAAADGRRILEHLLVRLLGPA